MKGTVETVYSTKFMETEYRKLKGENMRLKTVTRYQSFGKNK